MNHMMPGLPAPAIAKATAMHQMTNTGGPRRSIRDTAYEKIDWSRSSTLARFMPARTKNISTAIQAEFENGNPTWWATTPRAPAICKRAQYRDHRAAGFSGEMFPVRP